MWIEKKHFSIDGQLSGERKSFALRIGKWVLVMAYWHWYFGNTEELVFRHLTWRGREHE